MKQQQQQRSLEVECISERRILLCEVLQTVITPPLRHHLDEVLPLILLLTHHPLLVSSKSGSSCSCSSRLWRTVLTTQCLNLKDVAWHVLFSRHISTLVSDLCGSQGLLHPSLKLHRIASLSAISTVLSATQLSLNTDDTETYTTKQLVRERIVSEIAHHLLRLTQQWMHFSSEDIHIYLTPAGQLYHKVTLETKSDTKSRRVKSGTSSKKKDNDDDWEAQLRAEREKKKQQVHLIITHFFLFVLTGDCPCC